ncbi:PH domain-containing protein [Iamia sp.]|uniref:PH domain-containing protein n=1 Tax=Iamia sp. TaxID=2722710 RepID=UPI002CC4B456|nr:PH domain-containing protein [Iamia sp.]HXH56499.1 PH domain-containing protein [Iamia sp.]
MSPRTYRNVALVAFCGAAGCAFLVLFVLLLVADPGRSPSGGSATELYLIGLGLGAVLLRGARIRVRLDDGGVTVYSLLRTHRVPWDQVVGAVADSRGLVVLRAEGRAVLVQSLGQTALASRLRPAAQGDAIAEAIDDAAAAARTP